MAAPTPEAVITSSGHTIPFSIDLSAAPPVQPTHIEGYTASPDHSSFIALTLVHQVGVLCRADSGSEDLLLPDGDNRGGSGVVEDRSAAPVTYKDIFLRFLWLG